MGDYSLLVWSEPHPGQEEIYNDWYDNVHLAEVCAIHEFVGAKRFKFEGVGPTPREYLAVYDIQTNEPSTIIDRLMAASATMNMSPAINVETTIMSLVRKI